MLLYRIVAMAAVTLVHSGWAMELSPDTTITGSLRRRVAPIQVKNKALESVSSGRTLRHDPGTQGSRHSARQKSMADLPLEVRKRIAKPVYLHRILETRWAQNRKRLQEPIENNKQIWWQWERKSGHQFAPVSRTLRRLAAHTVVTAAVCDPAPALHRISGYTRMRGDQAAQLRADIMTVQRAAKLNVRESLKVWKTRKGGPPVQGLRGPTHANEAVLARLRQLDHRIATYGHASLHVPLMKRYVANIQECVESIVMDELWIHNTPEGRESKGWTAKATLAHHVEQLVTLIDSRPYPGIVRMREVRRTDEFWIAAVLVAGEYARSVYTEACLQARFAHDPSPAIWGGYGRLVGTPLLPVPAIFRQGPGAATAWVEDRLQGSEARAAWRRGLERNARRVRRT